jgi:SAM-dependent methyltransferase
VRPGIQGLSPDCNLLWGLPWDHRGDFVTFDWHGFVDAPSIPLLFARHHHETVTIEQLLTDKDVQRSLEFGCGFGRLTPTFARLSARHTAVDIDADALAAARGAYPSLDFQLFDGRELPFKDDTFDLVVTWAVLQHIRPELIDEVLAEVLRVLRADGRLLLYEGTRGAGEATRHSWHRHPSFYQQRVEPLRLTHSEDIAEIDRIEGLESPGRVMLFEPQVRAAGFARSDRRWAVEPD